jgi:hypothetical protein
MTQFYTSLKDQVERASGPDIEIEWALWRTFTSGTLPPGQPPPLTRCAERILHIIEQLIPGFVYLMWRDAAGRHHASFAADDRDLDSHAWRGEGASPALACAAALLTALDMGIALMGVPLTI